HGDPRFRHWIRLGGEPPERRFRTHRDDSARQSPRFRHGGVGSRLRAASLHGSRGEWPKRRCRSRGGLGQGRPVHSPARHPPPKALKTAIWSCTKAASDEATAASSATSDCSVVSKSRVLREPAANSSRAILKASWILL